MSSAGVTSLDHMVLTVADIDAMCAFYERALGVRRVEYGDGRVALGFGDQRLNLHAIDALHPPVALRPTVGSADLCFTAPGLVPVLGRLRDAGVPLVDGPVVRTGATGPIASIYIRDPDGNLVEVGAPQDRVAGHALRPAEPEDRTAVERLLREAELPLDGIDDAWPRMVVASAGDGVVGAAGLEAHGGVGLLRSVVVHPAARGGGLGEELVWRVVAAAAADGIDPIWLLTFIPDWFERRGFLRANRSDAPAALQASAEFRGACPETAAALLRERPRGRPDEHLRTADPRYPIGRRQLGEVLDAAQRARLIDALEGAPLRLRTAVAMLDDAQLDTPYREAGWTVRQVVHHLADAHANGAQRLRLALTEDRPVIRPYDESAWGALADASTAPVAWSLDAFEATHRRMVVLLRMLDVDDFARRWVHPTSGEHTLDAWLQIYAWHASHHVAQIEALRVRRGW